VQWDKPCDRDHKEGGGKQWTAMNLHCVRVLPTFVLKLQSLDTNNFATILEESPKPG
jgi:hypothetical protein